MFPERWAAPSIRKYLSEHIYEERDLTHPRRSPKLNFEARISRFG